MSERLRLVLASFLMLFVELVLIRWLGANVLYLSYFSNFVLLGSFLGIGLGFLLARARTDLFPWGTLALVALVAFVRAFPVAVDRTGAALIYFGTLRKTGLPVWVMLPAIFLAVAAAMATIAQGVARIFDRFAPLEAYRLDILGSIGGIAGFSLLSFLGAPPLAWGAVIGAAYLALLLPRVRVLPILMVAGLLVLFGLDSFRDGIFWSPYYKIDLIPGLGGERGPGLYAIEVNGIPHQVIMPTERRRRARPTSFLPYDRIVGNPLRDVLIVGAGSGSDVAIALEQGAGRVDAVEIDPKLQELGRDLHPDHPYQDPRVRVVIDDGRAFLQRTDRTYDLILFALPDSLTLVSGQSSLRLESYLFTQQALQEARDHLAPGGAFGMYNYYRQPWLIDRLAGTLQEVYGRAPCLDTTGSAAHFALLMDAPRASELSCTTTWKPADPPVAQPATDDHPFLYLRGRTIPALYSVTLALILLASALLVRGVGGPIAPMRGYLDLFFMGAAFLLLETKNVVGFALWFGTTWFVNALVFGGILLAVLAAVEVARRWRPASPARLYLALFAALGVAYAVPAGALLALPALPRFATATGLAFAPVFLANLVFAERFRDVGSSTTAFGANLLGAMVGGVLEYTSLVIGYRGLLVVAGLLYALAFAFGRRYLLAAEEAPAREAVTVGATSTS